ncbi:tRNA preQ1(34) S-adenosylmethionine ribosyltransferase-isomerase QueA [Prosthecochloris sp.]|uniref:tRNA preQ1(34) S-adenosylmethionine ribosyltransferase-isomerase QueA n=1 Tax=Prosthecochloris sp. TaxID=290513 RepID=UPI0025E6B92A|nr:tRNA preQ1(34) S-adenosylmethionine ribosyltransferase-isomerase QueA [Prosthecochloris sp.]
MKVSDYDYELPQSSIAIYPPTDRGTTRLEVLHRTTGSILHAAYAELGRFIEPGDLLVLNNSRVVQARLFAQKTTGAKVELVLLEKHDDCQDLVMYRGRLKPGDVLLVHGNKLLVSAVEGEGVARVVCQDGRSVPDFFADYGDVPIPPYLKRAAEEVDRERYQTVFAEIPGSVAAPTASLNMTRELLDSLEEKGVVFAYVTLHVGLGTFLPIRGDDLDSHVMHREYYCIPADTVRKIRETKGKKKKVVAVGTTVTRSLEHAASLIEQQQSPGEITGEADIFIYPGYSFRVIDGLVTNYHAPRSTVLMLTAAFAGWENLKHAYEEALVRDYRFLSYGDSMLIV